MATQFQTQFLESIPRPIAGLKFSTLVCEIAENLLMQYVLCTVGGYLRTYSPVLGSVLLLVCVESSLHFALCPSLMEANKY
jgi:hypothetical protein